MKCINCQTDNNLKDRTANFGRCKRCNHRFSFEPTGMTRVKITDPLFAKAIADVSANNTLSFTPKQLLYLLNKRLIKKTNIQNIKTYIVRGILIVLIGFVLLPRNTGVFAVIMGILTTAGAINAIQEYNQNKSRKTPEFLVTQDLFQSWLNRWQEVNNINRMLPAPRQALPSVVSSDVSAYSFDRLVVCDRAEIAQLLIANNFHFENNCAVLSVTGYPQNIFNTVMEMVRRNPELKVYALHDATPLGVRLVHHLRTSSNWFENSNVTIYDLGLLPRQLLNSRTVFVRTEDDSAKQVKQLPAAVRQDLTPEELAWLESGKFVELESFTTQKLLQVVTQGMSHQVATVDDSLVAVDGGGGGFIFVSDSFG